MSASSGPYGQCDIGLSELCRTAVTEITTLGPKFSSDLSDFDVEEASRFGRRETIWRSRSRQVCVGVGRTAGTLQNALAPGQLHLITDEQNAERDGRNV